MGSGYFNVQKKEVLVMESETKEFVQLVRLYAVKEKELPYGKKELNDSAKVVELSRQILKNQDREYILAIAMDARTKPVAVEIVAIGTVNQAVIEPRDLFKHAIISNAAGVVMVHNHPSGNPSPSEEDYKITAKINDAGRLLGIPLLDHIIVGDDSYFSFKENNKI